MAQSNPPKPTDKKLNELVKPADWYNIPSCLKEGIGLLVDCSSSLQTDVGDMKAKLSQFERDNRVAIQKIRNDAVRASDRVSQTSEASLMNIKQQLNTFMDFVQKRDRQTENSVNTIENKVNDAR